MWYSMFKFSYVEDYGSDYDLKYFLFRNILK
jgi:hypothetical protein